ncbi:Alpha-tocopherol transfer protein-like [Papilio machaon]|uniref:Alpha-tocopherol transfer protein-like n=1 Tax=Papilio machaon TaxID=76193 RepID=A0A194R7A0_PAPMA|nr:Alpha-tocopherol transfer protein-like [Papilio machaon]
MPVRPLSPELAEKARNELNETDENKMVDSLQHLKDWLAKQPYLKARTDDQWLAAFLRGCKFSLERTKQKIDLFYTLKKTAPELTPLKYKDPKFSEILDLGVSIVLPKTSNPAEPRILLMRPGLYDPNKYSLGDVMSVGAVIQNIMLMDDDNFVVAGGISIIDLQGCTMAHFAQMNPMLMKKMTVAFQEAAPVRMKGVHYLNTPPGFETIFNFIKGFLNEKNKKRLYVHNTDFESLYKYLPKEVLPTEYGGNAGTAREFTENTKKKILEYSAWLDEEHLYGTEESKRPGKPKTAEELFGVEGSFRQLQKVIMIRELSPDLAHIAKTELNEDPKQTPEDIKHLREWIMKQTHLKARTDHQWLVAMLRGCKFSLERVKEKLDLYYTLRTTSPEVTLRLKPTQPTFINFLRLGTCIILPKATTGLHPRVILIRAGRYDPEKNSVADIMCILYYMVQILVMEDDSATVIGTKIVVDYEGTTLNHLVQANVTLLRKIVAVSQDSLPLRLKGSHHLNVPSGIETIFKLVSAFISEKAKQRLKIHKSADELFEHIPKDVMPPEYGGNGATVAENIEYWITKIREYKSWMEVEERLGTDESRRLGSLPSDEAGDKGSFRQLNID